MVKEPSEIKELAPELKQMARWLRAVKEKRSFPIVKMRNLGYIKKVVTKKGVLQNGVIVGKKSHWTLTEKGRKHLQALSQLGY